MAGGEHPQAMANSLPPRLEPLLTALRKQGVATARELTRALDISQPTLSRLITRAGDQVVALGLGRARRYAAAHNVRGLGQSWPLYRIDPEGHPSWFGQLRALHGGHFHFTPETDVAWLRGEFSRGLFPGLPWFMEDMRPQGFLGRLLAHRLGPGIGLRRELTMWDDDDIVTVLLLHGADLPGQFVLGEQALEQALAGTFETVPENDRPRVFAQRADATMVGEPAGSSAAGEQPKFTACVCSAQGHARHVIVKFSDRTEHNPVARRWSDLLLAEHVANGVLSVHGIACADTSVLDAGGRRFLESTRFDRIGMHGRAGFVTLAAVDDAHHGLRDDWAKAAQRLAGNGWITHQDADRMTLLWWFGRLIGNTDMHFGNLGFHLDDNLPLRLAPIYDMLPMHFRPSASGICPHRGFDPPPPHPETMPIWQQAARMAHDFWHRLTEDAALSSDFRPLANAQAKALEALRQRFGHR